MPTPAFQPTRMPMSNPALPAPAAACANRVAPSAIPAAPAAPLAPRLGAHHFAHLRAIAEGLDLIECARRFLGTGHGHEARSAHRQTAQAVRAIARQRGESAWRLIGLAIAPQAGASSTPSLDEFMAERDLDGWSQAELAQMHAEAYALPPKAQRREQLRQRQRALLARLESLAAEVPEPTDALAGWFEDATARKLVAAGIVTLGALAEKIAIGGRWHRALPGIGPAKAARIEAHLALLLPQRPRDGRARFALAASATAAPAAPMPAGTAPGQPGSASLLHARSDAEALEAWVRARPGVPARGHAAAAVAGARGRGQGPGRDDGAGLRRLHGFPAAHPARVDVARAPRPARPAGRPFGGP